ncbi:MAG: hypothetical protein K5886_02675 [Lachnospiraceae bacterium]|nr:hypothetical protein [Lachnospiraceae bacterium]
MINLYLFSTVRSPRNTDGIGIYILETQTSKGPATLTKVVKMDDVNDCKAALLLIGEAFSRITRIEPVTLFTNIGYLVGLYTDERLKKWHDSRWMSRKGRQVMNAELLKTLYEKNIPVEEVRQDQHSYYEWMKNEAEKELKKWRDEKCSTDSENSAQPRK